MIIMIMIMIKFYVLRTTGTDYSTIMILYPGRNFPRATEATDYSTRAVAGRVAYSSTVNK